MNIRMKLAIIGDKSMNPIRGRNWRIGASMGSVISWMTVTIGFEGSIDTHDRMTRMKIAIRRTYARI
jgi:hypothetical protein